MRNQDIKVHSPGANLDYSFNWGTSNEGQPWLEAGDSLATSDWEASPAGLVLTAADILPGGVTVVFVGGGTDGVSYLLKNTVTSAAGRTDSRTMQLVCRPQ